MADGEETETHTVRDKRASAQQIHKPGVELEGGTDIPEEEETNHEARLVRPEDELTDEERAAAGIFSDSVGDAPVVINTPCAFVVYIDAAGKWAADNDMTKVIIAERQAVFDDFYLAAAMIQKDVMVRETANLAAQMTVGFQQATMMQAMEAQKNAEIARAAGMTGSPAGRFIPPHR